MRKRIVLHLKQKMQNDNLNFHGKTFKKDITLKTVSTTKTTFRNVISPAISGIIYIMKYIQHTKTYYYPQRNFYFETTVFTLVCMKKNGK